MNPDTPDKPRGIGQWLWQRRKLADRFIRGTASVVRRFYLWLPIPTRTRLIIRDIIFSACNRFIFHTAPYQSWLAQRRGLSHLNAWFESDKSASYLRADIPQIPDEAAWQILTASIRDRFSNGTSPVDVIIPVYRGYAETLACIYSALASNNNTLFELIVINDASPDPVLTTRLRELRAMGLFTLLENESNLGFVATVNRGMQLHEDRDVVLLNSDTEVYNNWLDRLQEAALSDPRVATVTPLSNNAEICSYPYFVRDNDMRLELKGAALDVLAARSNAGIRVLLPTAVGFCMYIRRATLKDVGYFDAETFGRGYGEENDFCLRASVREWKHLLAGDVFVRHYGGSSFGEEKQKRVQHALRILNQRYPHYRGAVQQFIALDEPFGLRRKLDIARLARQNKGKTFLYVTHNLGGGTERHISDMAAELAGDNVSIFVLRPSRTESETIELSHANVPFTPNANFDVHQERAAFTEALRNLDITHVHFHHMLGFSHAFMDFITLVMQDLSLTYDFTAHDYFSICPRINLINGSGVYCGEPDVTVCETCVERDGSQVGTVPVWQWRMHYENFLGHARHVFVPNEDVATRLTRYFPKANITVRPHGETLPATTPHEIKHKSGDAIRVAIIGAIGPHKGSAIVRACARDALKRQLPISFHIIGTADNSFDLARLTNVSVTGPYQEEEVGTLLRTQACHVAFFPSVWPETFCYTLSIAAHTGLYPVAFDLGAQAQRIRQWNWGTLLPIELMKNPSAINDALLALNTTPKPAGVSLHNQRELYPHFLSDYYKIPA